jgi:molecular chaperone DnaK
MDKVDAAAQELRKALEGKDGSVIREKNEAVKKVLQDVGTAVYQQAQKQPQQTQPQGEAQNGDGSKVSDADYKVVDEGK